MIRRCPITGEPCPIEVNLRDENLGDLSPGQRAMAGGIREAGRILLESSQCIKPHKDVEGITTVVHCGNREAADIAEFIKRQFEQSHIPAPDQLTTLYINE